MKPGNSPLEDDMETWLTWEEAAEAMQVPPEEMASWAASMGWSPRRPGLLVTLGDREMKRLVESKRKAA